MTKLFCACIVLAAVVNSGCAPAEPLAKLSKEDRLFLFADTGTDVPFLGQPVDAGPLNCYPQRMNQGYVLIDTDKTIWLDSIRPSGVERHQVLSVKTVENGYVVKAKNGVSVGFELQIQREGQDMAMISWDGAKAELYRRCPKING